MADPRSYDNSSLKKVVKKNSLSKATLNKMNQLLSKFSFYLMLLNIQILFFSMMRLKEHDVLALE